jgi:hypothetical protein
VIDADLAQAVYASTMRPLINCVLTTASARSRSASADLIVLDDNPFEIDPHEIAETRVAMTMMSGRFTHGA